MHNQSFEFLDQLSQLSTEVQSKRQSLEIEEFMVTSITLMRNFENTMNYFLHSIGEEPIPTLQEPTTVEEADAINEALLSKLQELRIFYRAMLTEFKPEPKLRNLIVKSLQSIASFEPSDMQQEQPIQVQVQFDQDAGQSSKISSQLQQLKWELSN